MSDYKKTLLLPQTKFPMKANLRQREPEMLKHWEEIDAYSLMTSQEGDEQYILHDGPPYANGHIHMGTALNKVLKDIVIKSRNMRGQKAEYIPGWDCHGLPIEHKVSQELKKKKKELPPIIVRKLCREYAAKWLNTQRKEFKRLGVLGKWDDPYKTMTPSYEAATARELGRFMGKGSVVRGKKAIHWCCDCKTALAEAEVEYADHTSPSIYVAFPMPDAKLAELAPGVDPAQAHIAIWTTTPWTIPSNMAVAVHPDFEYVFVKVQDKVFLLAEGLLESCAEKFGWESTEIISRTTGDKLEGLIARHPLYDRESPIVIADYVTLDSGTGCVHTAPGHGREDYETGMKYGLEILSPLNDSGEFLTDVEFFAGLNVHDANPKIIEKLEEVGRLLAQEKLSHSYPHCWRCKEPVIFRATTQWFISMEENDLRKKSLDAIRNDVRWVPAWGEERIFNMIENRPDWCISRQRTWGVPIIALICEDCNEAWFDEDWVMDIVDRFEKHENGCDYWFDAPIEEIVPEGLKCPKCGRTHFRRESDILDVWFDSGTSFSAVVEQRPELRFPADLYLEGSDQHRGWFHSSLLASMGTRDVPPYRTVLTHGYVVDGEGRKMSKSIGNVLAPQEIIDKHGAEILRMWVSAVNYQEDIRISDEILSRLVDAYRRVRNTCKFILSNLWDFAPENIVADDDLPPLDKFALDLMQRRHVTIQNAYEEFEFHRVHHTLHNLCVTDLSAFYLDVVKDRLYVEEANSLKRRSAQTVLYKTLMMMLTDMAPVLSFTAEEAFSYIPEALKTGEESVFQTRLKMTPVNMDDEERKGWETLVDVRGEVSKAVEPFRKEGVIGKSLDSHITIYATEEIRQSLSRPGLDLLEFFIVSKVDLKDTSETPDNAYKSDTFDDLMITVQQAPGTKCERCWRYDENVGSNADHTDACPRCVGVLKNS